MKIIEYLSAMLAAVVLSGSLTAAANTATVSGAEGAPGSQVTVTVSLTTDTPLSALQISADLGRGAVAVNGSAKALGRASGHSASCGTKDGVTNVMLYSTAMHEIAAGTGDVAEFVLQLGEQPVDVTPQVTVKATDMSGNQVSCDGEGFEVKIYGATAEFVGGPAFDLGRKAIRADYTLNIPVRNTGTTDLVIDGIDFSAKDFTCESQLPLTVPPGADGTLAIGYHPAERGDINATAVVNSNSTSPDRTLRLLAQPFAVNEVHVGNVSGPSDTEVTVPITINNMDNITGFSLEFVLPEHLEYVEGSFRLSDRAADHNIMASMNGRSLRATAYSMTDAAFRNDDGEIASFSVRLSGRNSVTLTPAKAVLSALVGGEVTDVTSAIYGGTVSILYPQIYVSNSLGLGRTPITQDAKATLSINNYGTSPLTVERLVADGMEVTFDRETPFEIAPWNPVSVSVTLSGIAEGKLSGVVQIYSNDPDLRLTNVELTAERYAPNSIRFVSEDSETSTQLCNIDLILDNYDAISGLQFDLTVPDGFEPMEVVALNRASGFTAAFNKVGDNTVRYFVYSLSGSAIEAGDDVILRLPFSYPETMATGTYTVTAAAIKLGDELMNDRTSIIGNVTAEVNLVEHTFLPGDLNEDGVVNVLDVNMMINHILSGKYTETDLKKADLNEDGVINSFDLNIHIDMILNGKN